MKLILLGERGQSRKLIYLAVSGSQGNYFTWRLVTAKQNNLLGGYWQPWKLICLAVETFPWRFSHFSISIDFLAAKLPSK